jgi:putative oxidoreductase
MADLIARTLDTPAARDAALLLARLTAGGLLIFGVVDNIVSAERMAEFVRFLTHFRVPAPELMAPLSVWTQFAAGVMIVAGLGTRIGGLLCAANMIVALVVVDAQSGVRAAYPAASLIVLGLIFASFGGGRFALDPLFGRRRP